MDKLKMGKTDKSHKTNKTEVWSPERKDMKVGMFFYIEEIVMRGNAKQ